jgi:hypothetical protein
VKLRQYLQNPSGTDAATAPGCGLHAHQELSMKLMGRFSVGCEGNDQQEVADVVADTYKIRKIDKTVELGLVVDL